ncbi:aspartate-semialdehyde dehydrogenase [Thermodesulfobacteriota bacterium]
MKKVKVGVLGATGSVGQRFVQLLAEHPWFELAAIVASERSAGKPYREACDWYLSADIPQDIGEMIVQPIYTGLDCQMVFSALPGAVAKKIEEEFASKGFGVMSNVSVHRYDEDVPLVTSEVNPDHLDILSFQQKRRGWSKGFIVTNSNCSAMPLVITLSPLHKEFGIKSVIVQTMQALSGAGYNGVSSLAALDNVIPFIRTEEEKMPVESKKMLGSYVDGKIVPAEFDLSAHCNRVATLNGHMETVSVAFEDPPSDKEEIIDLWRRWNPIPQQLNLPSAPQPPIVIRTEPDRPQTRLDRNNGNGMAVTVGRLRKCEVLDFKYVLLSHNTIRGAAGASVLNAELMAARGLLDGSTS